MELVVDLDNITYPIIIEKGLLDRVAEKIKEVFSGTKIFILSDKNVFGHYGEKVISNLEAGGYEVHSLVLPAGEETKSFNTLPEVYNKLLDINLTRKDLIIALGGGVIGDLTGFVASTYLRGVDFIQIPTSLLAQVDSSVGGKVAVDLSRGKNLVGSFYHPKQVIIDPLVLNTLEKRFFNDGMAEVIKYGCIRDAEFFNFLRDIKDENQLINSLEYIIHKCCSIKKSFVENDEKDNGERMILNFGHTIGHGIEQYYNYTKYSHGEAVAIGMYQITKISEKLGETEVGTAEKIKELLIKYSLPYELDVRMEDILDTINLDKKKLGKVLNVILIDKIGKSKIHKTTTNFFV